MEIILFQYWSTRPTTVPAGSDHYFHTECPSVRPKTSKSSYNHCRQGLWAGRVDHWWLLSCFYLFYSLGLSDFSSYITFHWLKWKQVGKYSKYLKHESHCYTIQCSIIVYVHKCFLLREIFIRSIPKRQSFWLMLAIIQKLSSRLWIIEKKRDWNNNKTVTIAEILCILSFSCEKSFAVYCLLLCSRKYLTVTLLHLSFRKENCNWLSYYFYVLHTSVAPQKTLNCKRDDAIHKISANRNLHCV